MPSVRDVEIAAGLMGVLSVYWAYLSARERRGPAKQADPDDAWASALCELVADRHNGVERVRVVNTREPAIEAMTRQAERRGLVWTGAYSAALGVGRLIVTRPEDRVSDRSGTDLE
jgi:hypothetical protein